MYISKMVLNGILKVIGVQNPLPWIFCKARTARTIVFKVCYSFLDSTQISNQQYPVVTHYIPFFQYQVYVICILYSVILKFESHFFLSKTSDLSINLDFEE